MCRLPQLLRYFRLPPGASSVELRQVYLRRVKEVHPDATGAACPERFQELHENFREALELLDRRTGPSAPGDSAQAAAAQERPGSYRRGPGPERWGPGANQAWPGGAAGRGGPAQAAAVPCEGLPQSVVYPATAASVLAAGLAAFLLSWQRPASPMAEDAGAAGQHAVGARSPPSINPERGAWSGGFGIVGPGALSSAKNVVPTKASELVFTLSSGEGKQAASSRERRLSERQGNQVWGVGYDGPQLRGGVEMLPAHAAALDGRVWWLERCGASASCRRQLGVCDAGGDAPLHHGARAGRAEACRVLLRLGVDPRPQNGEGRLPEQLAAGAGHAQVAELLRRGGEGGDLLRHTDGLGVLAPPPDELPFAGLHEAQSLRRALSLSARSHAIPPLPVSRAQQQGAWAAERVIGVVQGCLMATDFDLKECEASADAVAAVLSGGADAPPGPRLRGILVHEPPKAVTEDAPGHWVALQWQRQPRGGEGPAVFWRLDPVRGPFRLTLQEAQQLLERYPSWQVLARDPAAAAGPSREGEEAAELLRRRAGEVAPVAPSTYAGGTVKTWGVAS